MKAKVGAAALLAGAAASSLYDRFLRPRKVVKGKVVLITGAAGGLGEELVKRFATLGARLILWDIDVAGAERVARSILMKHPNIEAPLCQRCDLSDRDDINRAARAVLEKCGTVDVLVNNAGVVSGTDFLSTPDRKIDLSFRVNALAHLWTCKAFLPSMIRAGGGHVIAICSVAAHCGAPRMVDYASSKAAARAFALALRTELRAVGAPVDVTCVCPAHIDTRLFRGFSTPLVPTMTAKYVARCTIEAFQRSQVELVLPIGARMGIFIRAVSPQCLVDASDRFGGVNEGMHSFDGTAANEAFAKMGRSQL